LREYIAGVVMIIFTSLSFWGMNSFGFANNQHDILWTLGAAFALLAILLINVYIYFAICQESPWVWQKDKSSEAEATAENED
tara:strand:- start:345 stop:590 length:246 start_codon:yes stop_codon:yes gene_type:complete